MNQATAVGQKWFAAVEAGDIDRMAEMLADDVDFQIPGGQFGRREDAVEALRPFTTAFSDTSFTIDRWIEQEDVSVAEGIYRATHTDVLPTPMGDVPPSGNTVSLPFVSIFGEREGRVALQHAYWDNATFMMQIGAMPGPDAG
ncbi:MAG TPA: nuclear transport factor 2 family protein [Actinomycetota bacterium]|nr:nuclear transport factor 2 family protein [Actinomycetota bacterium]